MILRPFGQRVVYASGAYDAGVRIGIKRWLLCLYIRLGTRTARLDSRRLSDYCDYKPAHERVRWLAKVNGRPFGQSCTKHVGALLVDAQRAGTAVIEPVEREPSRLTPVIQI